MGKFIDSKSDQIGTSQKEAEAAHATDEHGRSYAPAEVASENVPTVSAVSVNDAVELDKRLKALVADCEGIRRDLNRLFGTGSPPVSLARLSSR